MANIPPSYPQYSQPVPPAQPYPQYMSQYPPPPPPPIQQYNNPYPQKPQRQIRTKIIYRDPPKPSNAIFIKNIPYDLSNEEFQNIYSKFGEIASVNNLIKNRGIAFITYYSIQSAINAVEQMQNVKIHDRCPVTLFSYRPPPYSGKDPKDASSIVIVQPEQPTNQLLSQDLVSQAMSKFGQIYHIQEIGHNQITVQFCDLRFAKLAAESAANIDIGGIPCKVELYVEPAGDAVLMPQQYPSSRTHPGPPSQMQMPQQIPPSYQQMPPSYQHPPPPPPPQQMPMPPPPPPPQYSQQMQIPQYGPPQQMQQYQYGSMPPQMASPPPPPPPSAPPQNSSPPSNQSPYQAYSPNHQAPQDITASLLHSVLK